MKKYFSDNKILIFLGFLLFSISAALIYSLYRYAYRPSRISLPSESLESRAFITQESPSEQFAVEPSLVAKKVDLQRKLISPASPADVGQIEQLVRQAGGEIVKSSESSLVVNLSKEIESEVTEELETRQLVDVVETDRPVSIAADQIDWGIVKIEVPPVWETTKADGVSVAIIDTGIDYNHPNLRNRYIGGYDFVNDNDDPFDDHGHGTHVAGIVAAEVYSGEFQGGAPQALLYAVKALGADGTGYVSDVVNGVDWAIDQNAQVINFSLGTTHNSQALENKLIEAQSQGIILVAAAGNTNGGSLLYPAAYSSVIAVSATDANDQFASFSSVGAELAAPGVAITSTVPGDQFATWSGTSMAAPHVSASAALMLANNQPNIRSQLQETALDLGDPGHDIYYGYGRIIAKAAVLGEDTQAPIVTFIEPEHQDKVNSSVSVVLSIQDENEVESAALYREDQLLTNWENEPYSYEWDASNYIGQEVTLIARAIDDSGNEGASQITVQIVDESEILSVPVEETEPISQQAGESIDERQDLDSPAQEVRQDTYHAPRELPSTTNINQRNPQPSPAPAVEQLDKAQQIKERMPDSSEQESDRRPTIRGVRSDKKNFWQLLREFFFR